MNTAAVTIRNSGSVIKAVQASHQQQMSSYLWCIHDQHRHIGNALYRRNFTSGDQMLRRRPTSPKQHSTCSIDSREYNCFTPGRNRTRKESSGSWDSRLSTTVRKLSHEQSAQVLPHKYYWEWTQRVTEVWYWSVNWQRLPQNDRLINLTISNS